MRVLVTGHLGYIGTVLTPMLLERGHHVTGLDSDLYHPCTFGREEIIAPVPLIRKDIRDVSRDDVEGFDAVLHLAGLSNDPLGDLNPELTFEINHLASVRLAKLCKEANVSRFVFSSSCSNYGAAGEALLDETADFHPVTPYAQSKLFTERDLSQLADEQWSPTFLRNATAYGFSPRIRFDLVVNNLTAWAFTTGKVHLKSDGTAWRPLVHVRDIARAFLAVVEARREAVHNQAFNICESRENYRIRDVATLVGEVVPGSEIEFGEGAGTDTRNYRVSGDRFAAAFPEFRPQMTVPQGIEELYQKYQEIGVLLDEFEGPRYKRVAFIQQQQAAGQLGSDLRRCLPVSLTQGNELYQSQQSTVTSQS